MPKAADDEVRAAFAQLVNMTPRELAAWRATARSSRWR
jgi:hypothetical protein